MKNLSDEPAKKFRKSNDDYPKDTLNTQKGTDGNVDFEKVSHEVPKSEPKTFSVFDLDMSANEVQEKSVSSSASTKVRQTHLGSSDASREQGSSLEAENISCPVIIEMFL